MDISRLINSSYKIYCDKVYDIDMKPTARYGSEFYDINKAFDKIFTEMGQQIIIKYNMEFVDELSKALTSIFGGNIPEQVKSRLAKIRDSVNIIERKEIENLTQEINGLYQLYQKRLEVDKFIKSKLEGKIKQIEDIKRTEKGQKVFISTAYLNAILVGHVDQIIGDENKINEYITYVDKLMDIEISKYSGPETKKSSENLSTDSKKYGGLVESVEPQTVQEELKTSKKEQKKKRVEPTLRQKYDINNEESFNSLLEYYAQMNKEYYSNGGKKHTEEEIRKRKNMNAQFKRIIEKKAASFSQNEDGGSFSGIIKSIENGEMFSYAQLKEVAASSEASVKLFQIMASGVYEKGDGKVRLTQKQRVALASTLEIISGMRLDMDKSKKQTKSEPEVHVQTQGKTDTGMGA